MTATDPSYKATPRKKITVKPPPLGVGETTGTNKAARPTVYEPIKHEAGAKMADRVDAEIEANALGHQWVAQATISIDYRTAKRTALRGSFRSEGGMRIDALETMCHVCRQPFDRVGTEATCPGQVDNTHLIGGDQRVRAPRIVHQVKGPISYHVVNRRGMSGYSVHAGT